jgi:hypothetical protein
MHAGKLAAPSLDADTNCGGAHAMLALILCLLLFAATACLCYRSLACGLLALLTAGYVYGIARANLTATASHFLCDSAVLGFYLGRYLAPQKSEAPEELRLWTVALIAWPCLLCLIPFQNIWVTLVGLRGNIFFLPLLLWGARLKCQDMRPLVLGIAVLNLAALGVGVLEYSQGIERFIPRNEVTAIIYASRDAGSHAFRIPSIFSSAHAYGGTMVLTIPLLFGAWSQAGEKRPDRWLFALGMVAALGGILIASARLHFVVGALLVLLASLTGGLGNGKRITGLAALAAVAVIVGGNERLQRFTTLRDEALVTRRVEMSVNSSFWQILRSYPFGNGLGGGGTSMPYFLQDLVRAPIYMENEYARIVAEQGFAGLLLWAGFIGWHLQRRTAFRQSEWLNGRRLAWFSCTAYFGTGLIGTGLLTAVPQSLLLLLTLGWISTDPVNEA